MITRSFRYGISSLLTLLLRSTNFILEIQFGLADLEYVQIKILFNGILKVSKVLFYFSEMLLFKFIQSYLVIPIIDEMHCCRHASLRFWRTFTWILAKLTDKGVPFTMFNNRILLVSTGVWIFHICHWNITFICRFYCFFDYFYTLPCMYMQM